MNFPILLLFILLIISERVFSGIAKGGKSVMIPRYGMMVRCSPFTALVFAWLLRAFLVFAIVIVLF